MQYSTYIFYFQTLHAGFLVSHLWQRLIQVNYSTIFLFLEVEISLFIYFPHSRQRLTQTQYFTFFTFRHFILFFHFQTCTSYFFLGAHLWQRLTQVNYSTIFLFLEVEISLLIFISHSRQRLTQMQYSTFFTFRHFILFFLGAHLW